MRCPRCNHPHSKVIDSRTARNGLSIKRRRACLDCGHRYTTAEEIQGEDLPVRKRDGSSQEFDANKIKRAILKAVDKREVDAEQIEQMVTEVVRALRSEFVLEIPSQAIAEKIMQQLKQVDKIAYVRFAIVYKDFKEIAELEDELLSLRNFP